MTGRCDTGARCVEMTGEQARLTVADDGTGARFKAGPEDMALSRLDGPGAERVFYVHLPGEVIGLVTLTADGALSTSAHLLGDGRRGVIATTGTCTRTDG